MSEAEAGASSSRGGWLARLAAAVSGPPRWRSAAIAVLLGAGAALAMPPFYAIPLLIPAFTGLVWLIDGRRGPMGAAAMGWLFGLGYFLLGLHWVGNAFLVNAERHALVMAPAVVGLAAGMALFPALAAALARLAPRAGCRRPLALAAAWVLLEWVRGWFLSGFPWNFVGHAWTVSDAMLQAVSLAGVYGLGAVTVFAAAAPARATERRGGAIALAGLLALGVIWGLGHLRLTALAPEEESGRRVRLVQPNIAQKLKWRRELRQANFDSHLAMSRTPPPAPGTLVIWPETATPFFLDESPAALRRIAASLPKGGLALIGAPRRASAGEFRLWNSLLVIDATGRVVLHYDKQHLVPFGEYLPFRAVLGRLGLDKFAAGGVDYSPGPGPLVLARAGLPAVQPLICYEAIFSGETPATRPEWLLNVTNDAWFGDSSGPRQHFEISRIRAVEQGVPLVRAANTGISAVVDALGRTRAALPSGVAGILDEALPAPLADPPLYWRFGDLTWIPVVSILLFTTIIGQLRRWVNSK